VKGRTDIGHEQDRIRAWLDGELAPDEAARVREHCAACPDCARALAELTATWQALALGEAPPPPRPAWPGVRAALAGRARARVPRLRLAFGGAGAVVAGLAIGLALGLDSPAAPAGEAAAASGGGSAAASELVYDSASLLVGTAAPTLEGIYAEAGATTSEQAVSP